MKCFKIWYDFFFFGRKINKIWYDFFFFFLEKNEKNRISKLKKKLLFFFILVIHYNLNLTVEFGFETMIVSSSSDFSGGCILILISLES